MSGREISWDDEDLGSDTRRAKKGGAKGGEPDLDLDLDDLGLADDEEKPKTKKKATKKAKKKAKKKDEEIDLTCASCGEPGTKVGNMIRDDRVKGGDEKLRHSKCHKEKYMKVADDDLLDLDDLGLADDDNDGPEGMGDGLDPDDLDLADDDTSAHTKARGKSAKKRDDLDEPLDLDDLGLADDEELIGVDSGGAVHAKKKKKKTKKVAKKKVSDVGKGIPADSICKCGHRGDAHDYRTRKCHCECEGYELDDGACDRSCETKTEETAAQLGIYLSMECPVCRSIDPCECEEEDRSFVRRTRFEEDVKKVARCPRCQAPLSVIYLPRPGLAEPLRLAQFEALWACSCCHTEALATAVLGVKRA